MTSANVTEYTIRKDGVEVGRHRQHVYCKTTWGELLKFTPADAHTITAWGYDEEEERWERPPVNLQVFIDQLKANRAQFRMKADLIPWHGLAKPNPPAVEPAP